MRQLKSRGITLIEVVVALTVAMILGIASVPNLAGYLANSRLQEGANAVRTQALLARSEAIKTNSTVRLYITGGALQVSAVDPVTSALTPVRQTVLPDAVQAANFTANFDSAGRLSPFGTQLTIAISSSRVACGGDIRCPSVRIEAGGAVSVCPTGACP